MVAQTPAASTEADRRRLPRRQPAQGTTYRLTPNGGLGLVWNLSLSGVSMLVPEPPAAGAELQGALVAADGTTTLALPLRVAHVSRIKTGDYFLGAQFTAPLTPEQLRPFLGPVVDDMVLPR